MTTPRSQPDLHAVQDHVAALNTCAAGITGKLILVGFGEDPMTGEALPPWVAHFSVGDAEKMTALAMEWTVQQNRNVYAPLVVMRHDLPPGEKGGEIDIVKVLGLVADFDDAEASQWASRTPIQPTGILETSPGRFQCFYFFTAPMDPGPAKDLARRLQLHARCDFGTKDLSHVWRIDGTLNYPNKKKMDAGRALEPCLVVEAPGGSNELIVPGTLEAALPALAPPVNRTPPRPARPVEADDQTLLDRMLHAHNGAKIQALWSGDWKGAGYPSQSEADSALCYHLAFYCGRDASRVDTLFRRSGLMRDKWTTQHGAQTYGAMTIDRACANCRETYTPTGPVMTETPDDTTEENHDGTTETETPAPPETTHTDRDPGLTKILADEMLRTDHFARDAGNQLYVFERGVYRPNGEPHIAQRVKTLLVDNGDSKRWSSHRAREVHEFIRVDAPRLWDRPPVEALNLLNGLLDIPSRVLRPHDPRHLSPVQLPVRYDPTATCPRWESFGERVLPKDCRGLPYELVAASMRGEIGDQKAVLLEGPGENGKSTQLSAIVAFLGPENVVSQTLQRLELDKFAVVRLLGKLANVCADLPSDHLASTSTFKALTGGDYMTAERKFQGSFEMRPFVRLLFSTNHYPQSKDSSRAFFRRWLVIPFDTVLAPAERIPNLAALLAEPHELSGVLNRALMVLPKMEAQGGFSQNETTRAAAIEFQEMTDPLAVWLDQFTILSAGAMVTRTDLLIVYNAAATAAGRPPSSSKSFCADVRRLRPTVQEKQRTVHGSMHWVFLGLGMRTPAPVVDHDAGPLTPVGLFHEEVVDDDD